MENDLKRSSAESSSLNEDNSQRDKPELNNEKNQNQFELFENKLRSILFPEPIFSHYINELKTKPSKPVRFPDAEKLTDKANDEIQPGSDKKDERKSERTLEQQQQKTSQSTKAEYTRYLRTWKKSVAPNSKLTSYLSNLRESHLAKLITFIEQMHKSSQYTDLDLYVEDLCFPVHKLILACYAPFIFQKLERNRTTKNKPIEKLRLINIDAQSFATIIEFMYTGLAQPTEQNFLPVLNTAIHLFMFDFANAWIELYEHKFTNRTAQMLFRSNIAREYGWFDYVKLINTALAHDFEHLLISDQFESIQFEQLKEILEMDSIGTVSEVVIYLAVLKWLNFDFEERKKHALNLMKLVRFDNMNENELFACYNPPILPEVIELPEIKAMMADAFNSLVQQKQQKEDDQSKARKSQTRRFYRLGNAYKDQPPQLWCHLSEKAEKKSDKAIEIKNPFNSNQSDTEKQSESGKDTGNVSDASSDISDRSGISNASAVSTSSSASDLTSASDITSTTDNTNTLSTPSAKSKVQTTNDLISQLAFSTAKQNSSGTNSASTFSSTSSATSSLDEALTNDKKADRLKPEIRADMKKSNQKLITDGQHQSESKLAVLKNLECKPSLKDTTCRCKIKHASVEQCRRERAAQIIQRCYKKFRKLKTKSSNQARQVPKIKAKLIGKSIKNEHSDLKSADESVDDTLKELVSKSLKRSKSLKDSSDRKDRKEKLFSEPARSLIDSSKSSKDSKDSNKADLDSKVEKSNSSISTEPFSLSNEKKLNELTAKSLSSKKDAHESSYTQQRTKESTYRTGQLLLYSDSLNQEFCGFYLCTGISADNQLIGWKKHFQFKQNRGRELNLPYDTVVVSHGQSIYLIGGMQMKKSKKSLGVSKQIFKFHLSNRKIVLVSCLKQPRIQHSSVVVSDRLYVICGCKALNVPVNTIECIHLMSSKSSNLQSEQIKLPSYGRFGTSVAYFRSRLWIIGGIAKIDNNFHLLSEIWILDVLDAQNPNKWIKSKFPVPIAFAGICTVNEEYIFVVGGRCVGLNGKLQPSENVWCFSIETRRWQQIVSLNQPRCNCCCVLKDNKIYALGGSLENDAEHLRGQTGEFYELNNPKGWKMLNKNLPYSISGQSVVNVSGF